MSAGDAIEGLECAARNHLSGRCRSDRQRGGIKGYSRIESEIKGAISRQARNPVPGEPIDRREITNHQDSAGRIHLEVTHQTVRERGAAIEGGIDGTVVAQQTGDVGASLDANRIEITADQHGSRALQLNRPNLRGSRQARSKRSIKRTCAGQTYDRGLNHRLESIEAAAHKDVV